MTIDLTEIIVAIITLIIGLVAKYAIPYLTEKYSTEHLKKMMMWTKIAVEAAEMIYSETGMGDVKKAYVLEFLEGKGFTVDTESIDNLIESAVHELNLAYENY
jgi:hypothetical protein